VDGIGLQHTPWIGALVVLGALGLTVLSGHLDARDPAPTRTATRTAYAGGH
jgi:DHA1 family inner membrane transport protein